MARDGGKIEIRIGADASELESELSRASKALADTTTDAAKMGDKVDDVADDMKASAKRMGTLSDTAQNTTDEFGELSSGMGALASALEVVDPKLGAAARGLGDMAGAAEGALRLTKLQAGALSGFLTPKVGLAAIAVTGLAASYVFLKRDINAANARLAAQDSHLRAMLPLFDRVHAATLALRVANKEITATEAANIVIQREGLALFEEQRAATIEQMETNKALRDDLQTGEIITANRRVYEQELAMAMGREEMMGAAGKAAKLYIDRQEEAINIAINAVSEGERQMQMYADLTQAYTQSRLETARLNEEAGELAETLVDGAADIAANTDAMVDQTAALEAQFAVMQSHFDLMEGLDRNSEDRINAMRAEGDAERQLAERRRKSLQDVDDAEQEALASQRGYNETRLEMADDLVAERALGNRRITDITVEAEQERLEIERHFDDLLGELIQSQVRAFDAGEQAKTDAANREATKRRDQKFEDYQSDLDMAQEVTGQLADLGQARLDLFLQQAGRMTAITREEATNMTEEERRAANAQIALNRDAALKMWRQNKALAIAEAAQLALTASLKAFAENAGRPIYAGIVSGLAFAIASAKGALIASSPPPFQEGGMVPGVGAVPITAHGGEGVLTEQTTRAIGGKSGIDALNRGDIGGQLQTLIGLTERQVAGASNGGQVIEMRYKHKVLDTVIKDQLRSGTALKRAIRGRSRIGHS